MKKIIILSLISILILNFIISVQLILKEQIIIKVNNKNKEIINSTLEKKVENTETIKFIGLGQGWSSGELEIYYSISNSEKIIISESMDYAELERYIKENGYRLDSIALVGGGSIFIITIASIIVFIVVKTKNKKGNEQIL